jgi:acetyl-CoA carboxylase biotin carboxyl carrier protein
MPVDEAADLDRVLGVTRELVELVRSRGLARLVVRAGPVRWEIDGEAVPRGAAAPVAVPVAVPAVNGSAPHAGTGPAPAPAPADEPPGVDVLAPLVGVFYRSPSPGAPPFVEVGQPVAAGQQLAIVEAMKMMNEVVADHAGVLRAVHAADAEIVEFGQPLFTISPAPEPP